MSQKLSNNQEEPLYKIFEARLSHHFGFEPTEGQKRLFYAFSRFMFSHKNRCGLLVKGYAGTGKTSCVNAMVKCLHEWGINYVMLAPTGRAAKVLTTYTGRHAWTIHKHIYIKATDRNGASWFELKENTLENTVFFVDEASMIGTDRFGQSRGDQISGDLLDDLMRHVYSGINCRLVLIGDDAQLPPVGSDKSPALQLEYIEREFDLNVAEIKLDEVIRQMEGSGILENATMLRKMITESIAEYPKLSVRYPDVHQVVGDPQPPVEEAYSNYGVEGTIIITRSNKRANLFNQQVRARVLFNEEEISQRDRMMVLKNNYFWLNDKQDSAAGFIANGDIIEIRRVKKFIDRGNFHFCHATIVLVDYPDLQEFDTILLCNSIWEESASVSYEKMKELAAIIAEDYQHITNAGQLKKAVMNDEYYNALQVKFAYAITCHKSQGGQWPCVFVDQGYLTDEMLGTELNRWFYTAITRAQKELYLVGFEEKMLN